MVQLNRMLPTSSSSSSIKGKRQYRSQRAVVRTHVSSHIPSQWTLAKMGLLCLGTAVLAILMLSPILMMDLPSSSGTNKQQQQQQNGEGSTTTTTKHVGLGSLIHNSMSLRQNWKSFLEKEEHYIQAEIEKDLSLVFHHHNNNNNNHHHEQLAPKETLPPSQLNNLGRGVAGLPLPQTPALLGATRGTIVCGDDDADDVDVEMMAYWNQPQGLRDREFQTVFRVTEEEKFLTFEPDCGGWNNIRMR